MNYPTDEELGNYAVEGSYQIVDGRDCGKLSKVDMDAILATARDRNRQAERVEMLMGMLESVEFVDDGDGAFKFTMPDGTVFEKRWWRNGVEWYVWSPKWVEAHIANLQAPVEYISHHPFTDKKLSRCVEVWQRRADAIADYEKEQAK